MPASWRRMPVPLSKGDHEDLAPGDHILIARMASGDENALRMLCDRYGDMLFSLSWRMLYPVRADAEDAVQETLIRTWQNAASWRPDGGASVKTWLSRIASRVCVDALRRRGRARWADGLELVADSRAGAQENIEKSDTGMVVVRSLQTLPERQRLALVLFHYEGLDMAAVADIMDTTPKGVEGLLGRAREGLRRDLEKYKGVL